jgi:NAD(P)-dependent dehydrogenase (short-subunit alcohol dehydrogenase family)
MSSWSWSSTGDQVVHEFAERIKGRTCKRHRLARRRLLTSEPVLITGPSDGGIGAETALCLASKSPSTIILAGRDRAKIEPVIQKIAGINSNVKATFVPLDLSDQASIRAAAVEINGQFDRIDVLINNAAIMACPYSTTKDGFEVQFGTNFLGPLLFTSLLLPKLRSAGPGARIVNVSSSAHRFEGIRFDDLDFKVSMTNSSRSLHFKSF